MWYICEQRSDPAVCGVFWCIVCYRVRIANCSKKFWSCGEESQISFDSSKTAWSELVTLRIFLMDIIRFQCRCYSQLLHCLPGRNFLQQSVISGLKCLLRIDCRQEKQVCVRNSWLEWDRDSPDDDTSVIFGRVFMVPELVSLSSLCHQWIER